MGKCECDLFFIAGKVELHQKYRLQSKIKLLSFQGLEPSKLSGSFILGVRILGDSQSAWVMNIITWAKSRVDSLLRVCQVGHGHGGRMAELQKFLEWRLERWKLRMGA